LHRLGDGFGIAVVVLVPLEERLHVLGRDQAHVMTERLKLAPKVVSPGTGFHADQAGWALGERRAGEPEAQHNGAAMILADKVEAVLAQIDAQGGDCSRGRRP
jgi:hypothetical protein